MHHALQEACAYCATRDDYLIWAGFAGWALAGIPASPDLDLYLAGAEATNEAADDLARLGWERTGEKGGSESFVLTMARDGATVDLCHAAAAAMLFPDRQVQLVEGHELLFVSDEGLYLGHLRCDRFLRSGHKIWCITRMRLSIYCAPMLNPVDIANAS